VSESTGTSVFKYLWGINLIAGEFGSGRRYYHHNAHGDVVCLTDTAGGSIKQYDYDAFGVKRNQTSGDKNLFRYCGEYVDLETGAIYLRARYYDPVASRMITEDVVSFVENGLPNGQEVIEP